MDDAIQEEEAARIERKRRESRIASKDIRAKVGRQFGLKTFPKRKLPQLTRQPRPLLLN